jgi:hypothetical protein
MVLQFGFEAEGEVTLVGTQLGSLECGEARFRNPGVGSLECGEEGFRNPGENHWALRLVRATVDGRVDLSSGFQVHGKTVIGNCTINRDLCLHSADLSADECTLRILNSEIKGTLLFSDLEISSNTVIDVTGMSCTVLIDDLQSWPVRGKLTLDGFVYRHLRYPGLISRGFVHRQYLRLRRQLFGLPCRAADQTRIDDWLRRQLPRTKRRLPVKSGHNHTGSWQLYCARRVWIETQRRFWSKWRGIAGNGAKKDHV